VQNTTVLEIAELSEGEVVLRAAGGEGEPMVRIVFSAEARDYVGDKRMLVAKAMFEAGIRTAAQLAGGDAELDFVNPRDPAPRSVH